MFQYVPHSLLFDKKIQIICRRCTIPFFFFPRLVQNYNSYQIYYVLELVSLRPKLKLIRNKWMGRLHWDITKIWSCRKKNFVIIGGNEYMFVFFHFKINKSVFHNNAALDVKNLKISWNVPPYPKHISPHP